ncbi:NAD(P)/FAD-dependent oxidoreductase [Sphingobacterium siyangense]|uniref:NAD(P)/FAD-dependent oxidoreductase n=1 Tax=Sphingobacterium siyangense TaxID=459529 RepID=UPI003DA1F798
MVSHNCDVIILGAGPAGLSAAASLHAVGLRVVVIDYAKKNVQCEGPIESIHPGVLSQLEYLGLATNIETSFRGKYSFISDGIKTNSLNPYTDEIWNGHHICKTNFNLLLRHNLMEKGVIIKQSFTKPIIEHDNSGTISVFAEREQYKGSFLIKATGRKRGEQTKFNCILTKHSPDCLVASGIQSKINIDYRAHDIAYFLPYKTHWIWLSLLSDGRQCWTAVFRKSDWKLNIAEELPIDLSTADRWANVAWEFASQPVLPGTLSCGDSFALLDPASGKGIFHAIESGVMAAKAIEKIIRYPLEERDIKIAYENWGRVRFSRASRQLKESYDELGINLR